MKKLALLFFVFLFFSKPIFAAGIAVSPSSLNLVSADGKVIEKQIKIFNPNNYAVFYDIRSDSDVFRFRPKEGLIQADSDAIIAVILDSDKKPDNKEYESRAVVNFFDGDETGDQLSLVTSVAINLKYSLVDSKLVYSNTEQSAEKVTGRVVFSSLKFDRNSIVVILFLAIAVLGAYLYWLVKNG